jgi:hypothetical protein
VARGLCARLPKSVHIEVDDLRHAVKNGYISPAASWSEEQALQLRLAHRTAAETADRYSQAGYGVVIDDIITDDELRDYTPYLHAHAVRKVLLVPSLTETLRRNAERPLETNNASAAARPALDAMIRRLHPRFADGHADWSKFDTTALSVDATVDAILANPVIG